MYVGRRARLAVQEPANHNDIVEALGALDHAPGLHVQTTARLDHLAGLAQDLPLAPDLLAAVAIVRGTPHRVDAIGEGREGEPRREEETEPKLRHMLRIWLCTGQVATPSGYLAWWFYFYKLSK